MIVFTTGFGLFVVGAYVIVLAIIVALVFVLHWAIDREIKRFP